jgi:hypothetical protein
MSGNIYITSFDSLRRLDEALGAFSEDVANKIQTIGRQAERRFAEIVRRCEELESELRYLQSEYDSADEDDDTGYLSYKIQETEEKLRQALNLQRQAEEAIENYVRRARRVDAVANESVGEARNFLKQKLGELQEYSSVSLAGGDSFKGTSGTPVSTADNSAKSQAPVSLSGGSIEDLEKIPLPKGFKWVRLDEISFKEIPDDLEFRSDFSYEKLKSGLQRFEKEILPVLQKSPENSNAEFFENLDVENKTSEADGLKTIFNGFFKQGNGKDFIKIERFSDDSKYESIINGRHRLKVARDLGWKVIPAEVTEVNWSRK